MKKLVIGIPHNTPIDPEVSVCIFNLSVYLLGKGFKVEPRFSEGTYLSDQRNELSFLAKKTESDLLFIDSDMIFKPQEIDYILEAMDSNPDINIIGGLYFARREPHFPISMKLLSDKELKEASKNDDRITIEDKEYFFKMNLHEIPDIPYTIKEGLGVGTGFLYVKNYILQEMWKKENIRKHGKPFSYYHMSNGDEIKEDLAFCLRANKMGFQVWCDPRVELAHLGKLKITKRTHIDFEYRNQLYGNDISGWMSFNELNWLYHTVKQKGIKNIIEIGSWKGRSTHALLSATNGNVYAVDHFKGSKDELESTHKEVLGNNIYNEFLENVGKFKNLKVIKEDSIIAAKKFPNIIEADMVFIDGDHLAAKADILAWNPKCKRLICGHDFNFTSVNKDVIEIFGNDVKSYETIWFFWKG